MESGTAAWLGRIPKRFLSPNELIHAKSAAVFWIDPRTGEAETLHEFSTARIQSFSMPEGCDVDRGASRTMFDLDDIVAVAEELGFKALAVPETRVEVTLQPGYVICFQNDPDDTGIWFQGGGWHTHGDITAEVLGVEIEEVPATILDALKSGHMLVVAHRFPNDAIDIRFKKKSEVAGSDIETLEPGEAITYIRIK